MLNRVASPLASEVERIVHRTIGCALDVHRSLGPGFLESIYHKALRVELDHQRLKYENERLVPIAHRGTFLQSHRIDLIVEDCLIVEVKAVERLERVHTSQVVSYLRATNLRVGLLVNFNADWLKGSLRRIVL
jgi:GxxExxY protein